LKTLFREVVDYQVSGPEALCEELIGGVVIGQDFHCKINNLSCVAVKFGTYGRKNFGTITFRLRYKGFSYDLINLTVQQADLKDNTHHPFEFSPIKGSAGRDFHFSVEAPKTLLGQNVVIWKTIAQKHGQRYLNDQKVSGTVSFKTKCKVMHAQEKTPVREINSYIVPILQNMSITQRFMSQQPAIDAISLDLESYGADNASIRVDLREADGSHLFSAKILSAQLTDGQPLFLPITPAFVENKILELILTSDDGQVGKAIGLKVLRDEKSETSLAINNERVDGRISFKLRGIDNIASVKPPRDVSLQKTQISFNEVPSVRPAPLTKSKKKIVAALVDIITLNYNRADLLLKCYQGLVRNTHYPAWKWHVCDNGSPDNSVELLKRIGDKRISLTARSDNSLSFGAANNLIFKKECEGEYVLFLNNDIQPHPGWLEDMVAILRNDPTVGVVGSRLYYPNGTPQHLGVAFMNEGAPVNISQHFSRALKPHFAEVDRCYRAVTGACLLMRRTDFEKAGGFPSGYDYGYEDVDLCMNVFYNLKKKVVLCSGSSLTHEEAVTSRAVRRVGRPSDIESLKRKYNCHPDIQSYLHTFGTGIYTGPSVSNPQFSVITCITNPKMWMENIVRPSRDYSNKVEFRPVFNMNKSTPITVCYNRELREAKGKYLIFCHQDVLFCENWVQRLSKLMASMPNNWGVVGVAGWNTEGPQKGGLLVPEGKWSNETGEVQTVDECFIVVNRDLTFDESLKEPHFYSVDTCLTALQKGKKNFAVDLPVRHKESGAHPDSWIASYHRALDKIKAKWMKTFPVIKTTTCVLRTGHPDIVGVKPPRKK